MATLQPSPPPSPLTKETNYDSPLRSGWGDYHEYTRYSPSLLIVSDNSASLTQLTQWLESKGCQVYGLNLNLNTLTSVAQIYFDLMVVDLESFEQVSSKNVVRAACGPTNRIGKTGASANEELFVVLQKLKAHAELSSLPLIILTDCHEIRTSLTNSVTGPIYCLGKGPSTEAILLQIVAQIHYLSYRYI
jgi:CheY-like chemotaxis protein